jgi:hypothetical protein
MTDEYCPKDDSMPRAFCSHCRGLDPTPNRARQMATRHDGGIEAALIHDTERWFYAKYNGKCAGCGERFKQGTPVQWGDAPGELLCCDEA